MDVLWKPIPNSSQAIAFTSRADDTLYCGARGCGKTSVQLMRFRRNVGRGYGDYWRVVIWDREFKSLADLVTQSKRIFGREAKFLSAPSSYKWVWPSGEELIFNHAKKREDYDKVDGHEYPFVGFNELGKYPTSAIYDVMKSVNRSSFVSAKSTCEEPIPLEYFSTTNPWGPGKN